MNAKLRQLVLASSMVGVMSLQGCVNYSKEYLESTGVRSEKVLQTDCRSEGGGSQDERLAAMIKCAKERSGKAVVDDEILSYTEYANGPGINMQCFFGGYDRTLVLDRLSKGVGMVQPVLIYGNNGVPAMDEKATAQLIQNLSSKMKLKIKPLSSSRKFHEYLAGITMADSVAGRIAQGHPDKRYVDEVLMKFSDVDYIVTTSDDLVQDILNGVADQYGKVFKSIQAMEKAANKTSFRPQELGELSNGSSMLQGLIQKNDADLQMTFMLMERVKSERESYGFFGKSYGAQITRGCELQKYNNIFYKKAVLKAEATAAPKKSFAESLGDMFEVDMSRGIEISISNKAGLQDGYVARRKKFDEMFSSYRESISERQDRINKLLVPFSGRAFEKFRVTGYTKTKKLK